MHLLQDITRLDWQPPNSEATGVGRGLTPLRWQQRCILGWDAGTVVAIPESQPVGREERQVQEPNPKGEQIQAAWLRAHQSFFLCIQPVPWNTQDGGGGWRKGTITHSPSGAVTEETQAMVGSMKGKEIESGTGV